VYSILHIFLTLIDYYLGWRDASYALIVKKECLSLYSQSQCVEPPKRRFLRSQPFNLYKLILQKNYDSDESALKPDTTKCYPECPMKNSGTEKNP
jgi:hypothetical protein